MKTKYIFILFILLVGCSNEQTIDYKISVEYSDNLKSNYLITVFESANYELINDDSIKLKKYLNCDEIKNIELNIDSTEITRDKYKYKYHLIDSRNFPEYDLLLIGKSITGRGRNYSVLIRTINMNAEIVSTLNIASWNEEIKEFYGFELCDNWKKINIFKNNLITDRFEIIENGKIKTVGNNIHK